MISNSIFRALVFVGLIFADGQLDGFGQQATNQVAGVKTNFIDDAKLSEKEVHQVLELAKICGIKEPGEINTFHFRPIGGRGIDIKSVERISGRDTYFETLMIQKDGWRSDYIVGKDIKRIGEFTAKPAEKYTTRLRSYEFRKRAVKVVLANAGELDVEIADKAIGLIAKSKVKFASEWERSEFENLRDATPKSIDLARSEEGYRLEMDEPNGRMHDVTFKFEKGELIIIFVADIVI